MKTEEILIKKSEQNVPFTEAKRGFPLCHDVGLVRRARWWGCWMFSTLLVGLFALPLAALAVRAFGSTMNSYIPLVPVICGYLLYMQRKQLPESGPASIWLSIVFGVTALAIIVVAFGLRADPSFPYDNRFTTLMALSFVCFVAAIGFLFFGGKWMAAAAFPVSFMVFVVPLPDPAVLWLENVLKLASTEVADLLFGLAGVPVLRDGTVFQLPGIVIEVVNECSGIRSSWVLFMTSLLAAHVFLKSPWKKAVLVAFVVPLGILRNGFRILVIGWLCVDFGPQMIDSPIHRQGGPLFFALSLIPLFVLMWLLRENDRNNARTSKTATGIFES